MSAQGDVEAYSSDFVQVQLLDFAPAVVLEFQLGVLLDSGLSVAVSPTGLKQPIVASSPVQLDH